MPSFLSSLRACCLLLVCPGGLAVAAPRETGLPLVQAFTARDYEGHNQAWDLVRDRAGVLYVGNRDGVLTYDGVRWGRIPTGGVFVQGTAIDADDRIWIGGTSELGYLDPDGRGGRTFTSLRDKLPEVARDFGACYQVFALPHGIYFVTGSGLLRWHDGRFDFEPGPRLNAGVIGREFVLHPRGEPVRAFDGTRWRVVTDAPEVKNNWVSLFAAQPDGSWLLGTLTNGIWQLKAGTVTAWPTEVDARLRANRIARGHALSDGTLVISQRPGGVIFLDRDGRLRHYLDADHGLPTSLVARTFEDGRGNLWLSLDRGLVRMAWPETMTAFTRANGLGRGVIKGLARHGGRIYAGTSEGLFVLESPAGGGDGVPRNPAFVPVPGMAENVWDMAEHAGAMLVANNTSVRRFDAEGAVEVVAANVSALSALALRGDSNRVAVGTTEGILLYERRDGRWQAASEKLEVKGEVRALVEAADGSVWASLAAQGFARITGLPGTASADGQPPRVELFRGGNGLASAQLTGLPTVVSTMGDVRFLDAGQVFRFDAAEHRFVATARLDDAPGAEGVTVPTLAAGRDGRLWFRTFRNDPLAGPWQGRQFWMRSPDGSRQALPYAVAEAVGDNPVFLEEPAADGGTVLWLGGVDSLVRAELPAAFLTPRDFTAVIRGVTDGRGAAVGPERAAAGVPYAHRTLRLALASDRLDAAHLRFQASLDGGAWSAPSAETEIVLAGLAPGKHEVAVRARDADGRESAPARLGFAILPPWWLAWWAWLLYALGAVAVVSGVVRWRLHAIQRRNAELEDVVAQRTGELQARELQLREARDAAEAANRAKSVFLASMSHELRTPLNAILGYTQLLRQAPGLDSDQRRQLATVQASGDHLLELINDVLDLAKIEAGKVDLFPQPLSLPRLLAHLTEVFEPRAAQKGIAYALIGETALPGMVLVDEARLRQVLYNLLGNAIKFTERGRVELRVAAADGRVRFMVADTGIGIAPAEQAAIFGLFHQAAGPVLSAHGAGLGLGISQRLVRLMGGEITVTSTPGAGSRFSFELALPQVSTLVSAPAAGLLPAGHRGARRRALIVDDEPVNRDVLRALLAPRGFDLEEADNGEAAVACVAAQVPDLVLMDLRLKGVDGLTATRRIRALPGAAGAVRIVAISASVFPVDRSQAVEAGCDDFEPKPIRAAALLATIGRLLGLEWDWPAPETGGQPLVAPDALPTDWLLPPLAVLRALDAHADLGDIAALRAELLAARKAHPSAAAFLEALDSLAAQAQLAALRSWMAGALARAAASPA